MGFKPLLGAWDEEEQAYQWKVNDPRQAFVNKVRKKLMQELGSADQPLRKAIRLAMQQLLHHGVPTKRAGLPANVQSFLKWLDTRKEKKVAVESYIRIRRECEKQYPYQKPDPLKEMALLKQCLTDMKDKRGKGVAQYPNEFVKHLSGASDVNQKTRVQKIEEYLKDQKKLEEDYNNQRDRIAEWLIKKTPQSGNDGNLKKIFQEEATRQNCDKRFDELDPIELFIQSFVSEKRSYGLEEARVIGLLAKEAIQIYIPGAGAQADLLGEAVGKAGNTRVIFISPHKISPQFFVCSPVSDSLSELQSPSLDMVAYDDEDVSTPVPLSLPSWMNLRNIGNSCYLDAVLQALFASKAIHDRLKMYLPSDSQKEICEALRELLKGSSSNQRLLKKTLFDSKLHPELTADTQENPLDAAFIIELLTEQFFPELPIRAYRTATSLPGLSFPATYEPIYHLQVAIEFNGSLSEAIRHVFVEQVNDPANPWVCEPAKGLVIDGGISEADAKLYEDELVRKISKYTHQLQFWEMPEVLIVHLKRFCWTGTSSIKLTWEAWLPVDGILYVTDRGPGTQESYMNSSGPKSCYQVASYVVHEGEGTGGGHYKTYIRYNKQYFLCDDQESKPKEIPESAFFNRKDAYIVVFEKMADGWPEWDSP